MQAKGSLLRTMQTELAEQGFQKLCQNHRLGRVTADQILYNVEQDMALVFFVRSRLSSEFESCLKHLRSEGLSVAVAVPQRAIKEEVRMNFRKENIGLLQVHPPKAEWLVPFAREKATREVLRLKQCIVRGKLNLLAEKMSKWPSQGPICPQHKIPSEAAVFEDQIHMRGWKCKYGDFEIIHPLDAELSLYLNRFGPVKVRAASIGGQIVLRLPKLAAARYSITDGQEYVLDVGNPDIMSIRKQSSVV